MDLGSVAGPGGHAASPALLPFSPRLQDRAPCTWLAPRGLGGRAAGMASSASPVSDRTASHADVWLRNRPFPVKHIPRGLLWRPRLPSRDCPLHQQGDNVSEGDNESSPSSSLATLVLWVLPPDTNCCPWLLFKGL